jgi:hypothetical protein
MLVSWPLEPHRGELGAPAQRRQFTGDTIVIHLYGRYCNANKFAGEVDLLGNRRREQEAPR